MASETLNRVTGLELRLDVTNERLAGVERLMEVLVEEFRGLRRELADLGVAELRRRVERLEARHG